MKITRSHNAKAPPEPAPYRPRPSSLVRVWSAGLENEGRGRGRGRARAAIAFSLLEVMIAVGLFFMVAFAVLALVSQNLHMARALQFSRSPISSLAAQTMVVATAGLEEGVETGDFGDIFPDHRWEREVREFTTNGLMEVYLSVSRAGARQPEAEMILLLHSPQGAVRRPGLR